MQIAKNASKIYTPLEYIFPLLFHLTLPTVLEEGAMCQSYMQSKTSAILTIVTLLIYINNFTVFHNIKLCSIICDVKLPKVRNTSV
jgi:hypothetical protein